MVIDVESAGAWTFVRAKRRGEGGRCFTLLCAEIPTGARNLPAATKRKARLLGCGFWNIRSLFGGFSLETIAMTGANGFGGHNVLVDIRLGMKHMYVQLEMAQFSSPLSTTHQYCMKF